MKIYLTDYDLSKRADKTIYASQYSSFKAGIKVPGATDVKLFDGQTEISADASLFHGYKPFPLDAGDAGQKEYTIKADGSELKLKVVSTESTAAELNDKDTVFDLPAATSDTLGGIKVGPGLSVGADGTLSASDGSIPADLSVDTLYSANIIQLANPHDMAGIYVDCDPNSQTYATVNLPNFKYSADTTEGNSAIELGNISMGYGFRVEESMGSLTCNIACGDLTASYVSTIGQFYAPAFEALNDGNDHQTVVLGNEYTSGIYVKYDSANSVMEACLTKLTCGGEATFRDAVSINGYLTVSGSNSFIRLTTDSSPASAQLAYDGLSFTDSGGMGELFTPITVTIDGTQYRVLGHTV